MRVTELELLSIWEQGIDRPMFERALLLLEAVSDQSMDSLATLSIGQRDLKLLELREALFGRSVPCIVACPSCNEHLELNFDSDELRVSGKMGDVQPEYMLETGDFILQYRLPNSIDLSLASSVDTNGRDLLLQNCLMTARQGARELVYTELPPNVLDALSSAMAEADLQSHLELALTCPVCEHDWSAVFDIVSYLWSEIQNWAMRTMREVSLLARAFGWSESEILALSPLRRQLYLQGARI
ncbi:phage baseplate protein [Betaproteobacteria bacterium PRO4]|uniref:Hsp20/alpha crystallin family protein n=1 Tax=Nitrosomonas sp. TaxID=42353 RepID=UPI0025672968|nr:Hsp20/alpha crystallin family protein [Nitrosomonas sp.]MDL1866589.1 phage baseplate protein [Betaproteobacteria bacterium PRO4]